MPAKRSFLKSFFLSLMTLLLIMVSAFSVFAAFTGEAGMTAEIAGYRLAAYMGETIPIEKGSVVLIGEAALKEKEAYAYKTEKGIDILYYYGKTEDTVQMCDGEGNIIVSIHEEALLGKAFLSVPYLGYTMLFLHTTAGIIISCALAALTLVALIAFVISLKKPKETPVVEEEKKPEAKPVSRTEIFGSSKQPSKDALSNDKKEATVLGNIKPEAKENLIVLENKKAACEVAINTDATDDLKNTLNQVLDSSEEKYIFNFSGSKAEFLTEATAKIISKNNGKAEIQKSNKGFIIKADRQSALIICSLIVKLLKA